MEIYNLKNILDSKTNENKPLKETTDAKDMLVQNKSLTELVTGDKFKATVLNIQPNQVTIKLANGETMTAKSLILPDARMGEDTVFRVKENVNGQILLEMLKSENNAHQINIAKEALSNCGMYPSKENLQLVKILMDNNLPIDSSTLQKAAFFKYAKEDMTADKLLFLIKEDFPANIKSLDNLNNIMNNTFNLTKNINNMSEAILNLEDNTLRQELLNIIEKSFPELNLNAKKGSDLTKMLQKLLMNLDDENPLENTRSQFKLLHEAVTNIKTFLDSKDIKNDVYKEATDVKENLEFMNHIDNYKQYIQIPFNFGNSQNSGELHIFKDSKGKKNYSKQASVLLSLDYKMLGHIEVFINKLDNNLNFQFRASDDKIIKLISENTNKLSDILTQKGFTISGVSFKKSNEVFNVTDYSDKITSNKNVGEVKRYTFDMHV